MIIKSKFNTTCVVCKTSIEIGEQVNWEPGIKGVSHVDRLKCAERKRRELMEPPPPVIIPVIDTRLLPLIELIKNVDLKKPTLRLQFENQKVVITLTQGGLVPGSLALKLDGTFIGCVRPTGEMTGRLKHLARLQEYLLAISTSKERLTEEATVYGKFTNSCSFCGLELTHDYSVMVGYGPICAAKWDLPHAYNGTAPNVPNVPAELKRKLMDIAMEDE